MLNGWSRVVALVVMLAGCCGWAAAQSERGPVRRTAPAESQTVARVIVKFKVDSAMLRSQAASAGAAARPQFASVMSQRLGITLRDGRILGERTQVLHAQGIGSRELADRLAADSDVEYAVPSLRMQINALPVDDSLYRSGLVSHTPAVGQWYLRAPAGTARAAIDAPAAWKVTTGKKSIIVAVLDTGVRFDHPDLKGKLYKGYDFISDTATANDGGARDSNASDPGDWLTQKDIDDDPTDFGGCTAESSSWHGTQVSGLIGATTDNHRGMASVGRNVLLLPVRVLGRCGGFDDDIIAGALWAAGISSDPVANTHPARVLNLSLGSQAACSAAWQDAVNQLVAKKVVVVAAAGNDGLAVGTPGNCPGVIAVAGLRHIGSKVGYSDLGTKVSISAPAGNCVNTTGDCLFPLLTTVNTGTTTPSTNSYTDGGDSATLGTSFSSPLVAGTAALMLSLDPSLTPSQVRNLLRQTARPFPTTGAGTGIKACKAPTPTAQDECYCTKTTCGAGMLDAGAALKAVAARL